MLAFYALAIASGALAAVAVALWMRVRRLDKQNDALLEMMEDTLTQGMKIRVRIGLGNEKSPRKAKGSKRRRPIKGPKAEARAKAVAKPAPMSMEGAQITLQSIDVTAGMAMFTIQVVHNGETFKVKKQASQLRALARNVQLAWNAKTNNKGAKLPQFAFPENWSGPENIKKGEEAFAEYFKQLPPQALSCPHFSTFFKGRAGIKRKVQSAQSLSALEKEKTSPQKGKGDSLQRTPEALLRTSKSSTDLPSHKVPEGLNCVNIKNDSPVEYIEGYNYLDTSKKVMSLSRGKTFFTFACQSGKTLSDREIDHVDYIVNLSGFKDELADNGIEFVNIRNKEEAALYTVAIVKNAYMLPYTKLEDFTPELLCSQDYLHGCMPGPPKIWKEVPDNTHFRITKTIIPWVFNMTIQFKVSVLDPKHYPSLSQIDNCPVHKAIILERTKRDKTVQDATKKAKSVLLYTKVEGGTLCRNITICLNSFVPNFVVPFIDTLGSLGSKETKETAVMTRNFFKKQAKKKGRL